MNNKMNEPTKFIGEMYGTKVSVEYNHSDVSIDKVMDAFQTLLTGLGYHPDGFKDWVIDRADEYKEEDNESEDFSDWDTTLEDGLEDELADTMNGDPIIVTIIDVLKEMEVDGELMQYILEKVGMDEQMAIQLATTYPDMVEEHLAELKEESYE